MSKYIIEEKRLKELLELEYQYDLSQYKCYDYFDFYIEKKILTAEEVKTLHSRDLISKLVCFKIKDFDKLKDKEIENIGITTKEKDSE